MGDRGRDAVRKLVPFGQDKADSSKSSSSRWGTSNGMRPTGSAPGTGAMIAGSPESAVPFRTAGTGSPSTGSRGTTAKPTMRPTAPPTNGNRTQVSPAVISTQQGVLSATPDHSRQSLKPSQDATSRSIPTTPRISQVSHRLRESLAGDDERAVDTNLKQFKEQTSSLANETEGLPLEKRLELGAITHMYDKGIRLIEEGRESGEECKVRMGMEEIERANDQMNKLAPRP